MVTIPIMYIYYLNELKAKREYYKRFDAIEGVKDKKIYWRADDDAEYIDVITGQPFIKNQGSRVEIWIAGASIKNPFVRAVPENWKLFVDKVEMEQRFYDRFIVPGREIILEYNGYSFQCQFPGEPIGDVLDVVQYVSIGKTLEHLKRSEDGFKRNT